MALYLVDASVYVFRAYFAPGPDRTAPDGSPVGAVHGFAQFLLRLIDEEQPTQLGVAFDESLTTSFRNDFYPEYKAQRELPPPELEAQLEACKEIADAFGGKVFVHHRYEADDIIATLCQRGGETVIVSSDKDLAQLVDERVTLFDFARQARYDPAGVREKFGVRPDQIPDLLGLVGDSVDNIPGVRGVGRKSGAALLDAFGSIEELYDRLDEVERLPIRGARSLRAKLEAGREAALLSKRLATAVTDMPLDPAGFPYRGADAEKVDALFARLGFGDRMRNRIRRWA